MSKKACELCGNQARMFCESDQASLCWDCDEKVHAANFLVAKHSRTLLCHVCSSPTPWKAAGLKLGPTVSLCQACAEHSESRGASASGVLSGRREEVEDLEVDTDDALESESGNEYSESEEEEEEEEEEEDGENQVVPWSASSSTTQAAATPESPSTSCTEEEGSYSSLKRTRFESEDEDGYYSSPDLDLEGCHEECGSTSMSLFRPMKMRRTGNDVPLPEAGRHQATESSGTAAIIEKLRRFQEEITSN